MKNIKKIRPLMAITLEDITPDELAYYDERLKFYQKMWQKQDRIRQEQKQRERN